MEYVGKQQESSRGIANNTIARKRSGAAAFQFVDNRPETAQQRKFQESITASQPVRQNSTTAPVQRLTEKNLVALKNEVTLNGYNENELMNAIILKVEEEMKNGLSGKVKRQELMEIHKSIIEECYTRLYRIQDELDHNVPQGKPEGDGKGSTLWNTIKDDPEEQGLIGLFAAGHTYGLKDTSSFVSLCKDVEALATTLDKGGGKENVSNVIENAKYLCGYLVPNAYTWDPGNMLERIKSSKEWSDSPMMGGDKTMPEDWLPGTPTKETEVLYYGYDLAKYAAGSGANPFKKKKKK